MDILEGYEIKKGTKLYRRYFDNKIYDEMFLAFCPFGTYGTSHSNRPIQLWEAKITIYGNLMLKDARNIYRLKSSIPDVYSKLTRNNIHDTLSIKMSNTNRKLVTSCFKDNRITNWITSVEDKHEMELFLFSGLSENSKLINYLGELDTRADYDSLNSFHYNILLSY